MKFKLFIPTLAFVLLSAILPGIAAWSQPWSEPTAERPALDVPYVPTPTEVVNKMLSVAGVNSKDTLYDLGCGDGRIVVAAAKDRRVRKAIGFDLDPERIRESNANAKQAGVNGRVSFQQKNLFDVDISEATVVSMYLLPSVNLKLRPKLLSDLKPGTRLVSHDFDMGDWQPDRTIQISGHTIYYWIIPANASGTWTWSMPGEKQEHRYELQLDQRYQKVTNAVLTIDGKEQQLNNVEVAGGKLSFEANGMLQGKAQQLHFDGTVAGNSMKGSVTTADKGKAASWSGKRDESTIGIIDTPAATQVSL